MADRDILKERERSLEEEYFRQHEAKRLEKLNWCVQSQNSRERGARSPDG